jgi:hypothetical protein
VLDEADLAHLLEVAEIFANDARDPVAMPDAEFRLVLRE